MARHSLTPYTLRVYSLEGRNPLKINDINGKGEDFFDVFKNCIEYYTNRLILQDSQQTFGCNNYTIEERTIYGIIKAGKYGTPEDFYNVASGEFRKEGKSVNDAGETSYFFLFKSDIDTYSGTLILHTIGNFGIKTIFESVFNKYLESKNYKITLNPLISKEILKKISNTRSISEIRLIKRHHPIDDAEFVDHNYKEKDLTKIEIYQPRKNYKFFLKEWFISQISNTDVKYYEIMGERCEKVQIVIQENGRDVTLNFTGKDTHNLEKYELPYAVNKENGMLNIEYVESCAKTYLAHIQKGESE